MLSLNINEQRTLDFEVQLSGINPDQLNGALRFNINNIEYGFPAKFQNESIVVNIPPLNNVVIDNIKEGTTIQASLEINGNGFFLNPWSGEFLISNPVKMEAKIRNIPNNDKYVSETPEIKISKLMSEDEEIISESELDRSIEDKLNEVYKKRNSTKPKLKEKKKESQLNLITEDQIYKYMAYMGTKNKRVQDVIYEQAKDNAKTNDLKDIFKEVYKSLKRSEG